MSLKRLLQKAVSPGAFFFLSLSCLAQKDENKIDINEFDVKHISLLPPSQKIELTVPVSAIVVFDSRFDTSGLGIVKNNISTELKIIRLKKSLSHEIKNYYEQLAILLEHENAGIELNCFIKKLILSDHIYTDNSEEQKLSSRKFDADELGGILFTAEFYAKLKDIYIPLCRFDTIITGDQNIFRAGDTYLSMALNAGMKKLSLANWEKIKIAGKKLSWQDINNFYATRLSLPILNNPPVKGIYFSFDDFKNNSPSPREFTVDKNKTGDFLYLKNEKGEDILCTDLWGYSDGKDMFMFSATNYFKLHRTHNSFKIYGAKEFTARRNIRANFGLIDIVSPNSNYAKAQTRNKYYLVKSFFQLDMETGELY